jgi:hypothetical protein
VPAIDEDVVLVDLDRRQDAEIGGILLDDLWVRGEAWVEVLAVDDGLDRQGLGLGHDASFLHTCG